MSTRPKPVASETEKPSVVVSTRIPPPLHERFSKVVAAEYANEADALREAARRLVIEFETRSK